MNIAILTPIQVEHNAILAKLPKVTERMLDGNRYLTGKFQGAFNSFDIITHLAGAKNENLALATEKIIQHFQPVVVLLAGVAGGVKDVAIGDVVVGTKYYGYEFGKVTPDGFATRPESGYYSKELQNLAQSIAANKNWRLRARDAGEAKVVFGALAAGNKVVAATDSDAYRLLKQSYNDTIAVEMEAIGFGQAMLSYPSIRFLNIRGISDLLDGKSNADAGGSQEKAADNVAAFIFELLYQLDVFQFKIIGSMDIKELMAGSNHIGDIINFHLSDRTPRKLVAFVNSHAEGIKLMISKGEMEKAIDLLLAHAKSLDNGIFNEVISIARQWEELQRDNRIGILSMDEKFRLSSRITFNLLASTDHLQEKNKGFEQKD